MNLNERYFLKNFKSRKSFQIKFISTSSNFNNKYCCKKFYENYFSKNFIKNWYSKNFIENNFSKKFLMKINSQKLNKPEALLTYEGTSRYEFFPTPGF